jgi:hypothetical protein
MLVLVFGGIFGLEPQRFFETFLPNSVVFGCSCPDLVFACGNLFFAFGEIFEHFVVGFLAQLLEAFDFAVSEKIGDDGCQSCVHVDFFFGFVHVVLGFGHLFFLGLFLDLGDERLFACIYLRFLVFNIFDFANRFHFMGFVVVANLYHVLDGIKFSLLSSYFSNHNEHRWVQIGFFEVSEGFHDLEALHCEQHGIGSSLLIVLKQTVSLVIRKQKLKKIQFFLIVLFINFSQFLRTFTQLVQKYLTIFDET